MYALILLTCYYLILTKKALALNILCQDATIIPVDGSGGDSVMQNSLEKALMFVTSTDTSPDCFNVTIAPGNYTISRFFTINTNFVLRGKDSEGKVFVSFEVASDYYNHSLPPYALYFRSVEFVEVTGVHFDHSPGIIGFESVTKVVIKDSSFRLENKTEAIANSIDLATTL